MSALAGLVEAARREAEAPYAEAQRMMGICNSCRYCEGYCAVFQAMERRLAFDAPALDYLANLCHHCGACLYACQYAPPHEFAVNIPRQLAEVRLASYERFAWPRPLAALFRRQGTATFLALAASLALLLALGAATAGARAPSGPADFYAIFPHGLMVAVFGAAFGFAALAMAIGALRFRRSAGAGPLAHGAAAASAARLANLEGGGEGCYNASGIDHEPSRRRRILHHFTFYGFLLCFASTTLATLQHYALGERAPYPYLSAVVILGTLGGVGLVVGPLGLIGLAKRRDPALRDPAQRTLDAAFAWQLALVSFTGLFLLGFRETALMPALLVVHLAFVLAFFALLPYGKFVHGLYRYLALARHERERRAPNAHGLPD